MESARSTAKVHCHQVVIVGGGITGLTLALMLERLGVDYVLLEAYSSMTPDVGASIALAPNGLRILDQLGCYEDLERVSALMTTTCIRDAKHGGKRIMTREAGPELKARHGYPTSILSRHKLVTVLYDHVQSKERMLVNRKVVRIESSVEAGSESEGPARVHTADGDVFEAQLVVGADGVRSFVRSEMWRLADAASNGGGIPASDREPVPVEHACVFGTAKPVAGLLPGEITSVCGDGFNIGLMIGASGEVFFFWNWCLPDGLNRAAHDDLPRLTNEHKKHELARCRDIVVTDAGVTMGQVVDGAYKSGVTVLPHYTLKKWHAGRIVVLGDAAHKFNPQAGQGGNNCIESCTALVNSLQEIVLSKSDWSLATLNRTFSNVESQRIQRVTKQVGLSQDLIRMTAWTSWRTKVLQRHLMPLLPKSTAADYQSKFVKGSVRLHGDKFPAPPAREHKILFDDEKPGFRAPAISAA
ncbi:FAD dependent monooxygenase [Microdochium nivale]|nr:FAD dependent monooxygenase [Microdochium nivale]